MSERNWIEYFAKILRRELEIRPVSVVWILSGVIERAGGACNGEMSCKFPPFQLLTQIAGCHTLKGGIIFWFRFLSRFVIATMKVHVQGFEKGEKLWECSWLTTQSPVFPWAKPGDQTSKGKQKYSVITRGRRVASVCAIRAFLALAMRDLCTRWAPMFQHTIERDGLKRRKRLLTRTPA